VRSFALRPTAVKKWPYRDTNRPSSRLCAFLGALLFAIAAVAAGAHAETVQKGHLRVAFSSAFAPRSLPRQGAAPISVSIGGRISTSDGKAPPQLRRIELAINRSGHLSAVGLPVCRLEEIEPSTNRGALEACGNSLVGEGIFTANVALPQQAPFPSRGKVLAFAGREGGRPVILAHVYGTDPVPTSYTLPFAIATARGTYGTVLTASLPQVTSDWGFVTGIELKLNRRFSYRGQRRSFVTAGCPAAAGFPGAVFPLLRASFLFTGGPTLSSVLTRSCRAQG
jgi:hypothetical protein